MISALYDAFPDTITVSGKSYPIKTDFRDWVFYVDVLQNPHATDSDKLDCAMMLVKGDCPADLAAVIRQLTAFFRADCLRPDRNATGKKKKKSGKSKPCISYLYDSDCILSDFRATYGINLRDVKYMHYYEFRLLLLGLPESCETKKRMAYRSTDIGKIESDKERRRIRDIQSRIALPGSVCDDDIGDAFAGVM